MRQLVGSRSDFTVKLVGYLILVSVFIVTLYPFWYIFIISINDSTDTLKGGLYLLPRVLSWGSYQAIFADPRIMQALLVTVERTVVGAPLALLCIAMAAYALSRQELMGRKGFNLYFIFTMMFGGGLIPYYMVLKAVGLIDTFWVFIIPCLMNVFYLILLRTYFQQIPEELVESAKVDGGSDLYIFFRIMLPLSLPALATFALFLSIDQWNSWFDAYAFTYKSSLQTLQSVLVTILNQYQTGSMASSSTALANEMTKQAVTPDSIRMAATIFATVPILIVYPFLQRYFVSGLMVGAIKE